MLDHEVHAQHWAQIGPSPLDPHSRPDPLSLDVSDLLELSHGSESSRENSLLVPHGTQCHISCLKHCCCSTSTPDTPEGVVATVSLTDDVLAPQPDKVPTPQSATAHEGDVQATQLAPVMAAQPDPAVHGEVAVPAQVVQQILSLLKDRS